MNYRGPQDLEYTVEIWRTPYHNKTTLTIA